MSTININTFGLKKVPQLELWVSASADSMHLFGQSFEDSEISELCTLIGLCVY